jgi:hypothetical protein
MDLDTLKRLAGVGEYSFKGLQAVDENLSITGTEKRRIEREKGIKPGDPDWFKLWFSLPHMTGGMPQFRGRKKK